MSVLDAARSFSGAFAVLLLAAVVVAVLACLVVCLVALIRADRPDVPAVTRALGEVVRAFLSPWRRGR